MTVALSDILSNRKLQGDTVTFHASEDWMQGRTMFGGFLTALAVVAMRDTLAIDIPLRALQVNFIGPVAKGDVVYRTRLMRQGKNVSQVQCEIWSQDQMAGLVVGIFGLARQTGLNLRLPVRKPLTTHPDELPPVPFVPQLTPNFLQHIDMRWALGHMPYSGKISYESGIHIRTHDKSLSPEVLIVMLSDGPPTPVLSHFSGPVMASSVSWSLDLPYCPMKFPEEGWFQIDLDAVAVCDGYVNQSAKLWTPDGCLASLGHQLVAVFG